MKNGSILKLGLMGNIASGKSEAEKIFSEFGFIVVDLDKTVKEFYENNKKVKSAILEHFSTLDKTKIADIIFSNDDEKKVLEDIIHPELKKYVIELLKDAKKNIVISGALLYEAGFNNLFDKTIFIDASYDIRLNRLIKRNGYTEAEAKKRMDCQSDNSAKADYVIKNNSTIENLKERIKEVINSLQ